ncbi:MAG: cyclohexa-1,5-dienecarbonyl-CoA hydratase [Planctomycetota bacterium]|nr:MAG: cyclohexa-1,5-dienecarbonyl-CoA hydratase [Planctomycetota bacterium]
MSDPCVRSTLEEEGSLLRLTLQRPKANILDRTMVEALREEIGQARRWAPVRSVLIHGEGKHFSFGASVEEHRPEEVNEMLPEFHALFRELAECGKVLLAAVRGQCLGGGLELAAFCQRVFAAPGAQLGQPEIRLGVFAPVASLILPLRIGQARSDDLLLSGRVVSAEEALRMGLVDAVVEDPIEAARAYHREHLMPRSAAALRYATLAARTGLRRALRDLDEVERLYLSDLMATHDAPEGIASFLEKRAPQWTHN